MRDIKFRAWEKNLRTMRTMDNPTYTVTGGKFKTKIFGDLQWFFGESVGDYELMQYTGLKDKNGVEIYEGDIVQRPEPKTTPQPIRFEAGCFIIGYLPVPPSILCEYNEHIEVIGNIYENPELLQ